MRILFVGATGVIGRQVIPHLQPDFDFVLAARDADFATGLSAPLHQCDITDYRQVLQLMEGVDVVINCAIESPRQPSGKIVDDYTQAEVFEYNQGSIEVNVRGAYHLYEAAAQLSVRKFIFISSMTTVMGQPRHEHISTDAAPRPRNFYACTKLFGEQLGSMYAYTRSMQVLCLRLGQPYPSFTMYDRLYRLHKLNETERSLMVAVEDIAQAIRCALHTDDVPFGIYPILSESDSSWIDTSANHEIGYRPRYEFGPQGMRELVTS